MATSSLLDRDFLRKLEQLRLLSQRLRKGVRRGEHVAYRKGSSLDFNGYRSYQPGDDFRHIDWNIYNRLGKIMMKVFAAEEDLPVHIILDSSASMAYGSPEKFQYSRQLAAALGYIVLKNNEPLGVTTFSVRPEKSLPPERSGEGVLQLFRFLDDIKCGGETAFSQSLINYGQFQKRPGVAVIISDLLTSENFQEGLDYLLFRRFDIILLQILDNSEFAPPATGLSYLKDNETTLKQKLTIDSATIRLYKKELNDYLKQIQNYCLSRGIEYLRTSTAVPFEDIVMKYLRKGVHLH